MRDETAVDEVTGEASSVVGRRSGSRVEGVCGVDLDAPVEGSSWLEVIHRVYP